MSVQFGANKYFHLSTYQHKQACRETPVKSVRSVSQKKARDLFTLFDIWEFLPMYLSSERTKQMFYVNVFHVKPICGLFDAS